MGSRTDRLILGPDGLPVGWPQDAGIPTLGPDVLAWAETELVQPDGDHSGDPWAWRESQARFVCWWYALDADGVFLFRRGQVVLPKGAGKALALDTPLPTPAGWTTMGEVAVGDSLLDELGRPIEVLAATPVMVDRECFRVTFRDGSSVVADGDHLWPVEEFNRSGQRDAKVVTTRHLFESGVRFERKLTSGRTKCAAQGVARWRTLPTPALDLPNTEMPLPPYVLGYWLGDGDSDCPRITVDATDLPELAARAANAGVRFGVPRVTGNSSGRTFRVKFDLGSRGTGMYALRDLGVLRNKRIPASVLRGSHKQRLELLRGIMDSDGSADKRGRIELCLTREVLARDCVELMRTLGLNPRISESDAVLNGRVVGRRWRITVTAYADEPIFGLQRKVDRLPPRPKGHPYSSVRTVLSVERVESVPVRCVSVSSASQLYLAGQGMIPTHNSPMAAVLSACELGAPVRFAGWDGRSPVAVAHPSPWVQLAAVSKDQTDNTMSLAIAMLRDGEAARSVPGLDTGLTRIRTRNGVLQPVAASAPSREGQRTTAAILDETHLWVRENGGHKLAETIRRNLAKMGGRSLETTNTWLPGTDSVAERTSIYADKVAESLAAVREGRPATVADTGILRWHPSAHVVDLSDRDELLGALRTLYVDAPWVNVERLVAEVYDLGTPAANTRRFYLNEVTASDDAWVSASEWARGAHPEMVVADREQITLGFDGAVRDDSTALVACRVSDGFVWLLGAWEKPDPTPVDWQVDREAVDAEVSAAFDRYDVVGFYADPPMWQDYLDRWNREFGAGLQVHATAQRPVEWWTNRLRPMAQALERFYDAVRDGALTHDGGSILTRHVLNAHRRVNRSGITIAKENPMSGRKIDAAMAAVLAYEARADAVAKGVGQQQTPWFAPFRT